MSYVYELEVRLTNKQKEFNLSDKGDIIKKAIEGFNLRGFEMQNPKTLILTGFSDDGDCMFMTLESSLPLNTVGRALRGLSIIILKEIKDKDFVSAITKSGQLFTVKKLGDEKKDSEKPNMKYHEIEDLDVIKALLDYVYKKRSSDTTIYRKRRAAFEQIKKIAFDSGIIPHTPD